MCPSGRTQVNQVCITGLPLSGDLCGVRMCNSVAPSFWTELSLRQHREHETKVKTVGSRKASHPHQSLRNVFLGLGDDDSERLRALTAPAEDPSLVLSTHGRQLTTAWNSRPRRFDGLCDSLCWHLRACDTYKLV